MATYKEIKGVTVQTRDSDPELNVGAWASGGSLNTAKQNTGGAGTQTAGLAFGSFPTSATTESYDGSSWTETGDLNTAGGYFAGSFGTYTAAIGAGRLTSPTGRQGITESFDGTSWTEVADLNTTRTQGAGFGTSTAGYAAGGGTPSVVVNVESWNGSAWTEVGDINTARYEFDGNGISTSGLVYGGQVSGGAVTGKTESWDGSSWTETTDFNTARQSNQGAGTSNSNALNMGGDDTSPPSITTFTESWDGSSWTEVAEMATSRKAASGQGPSNTTAMVSGGNPSLTATEEWSFPPPTAAILTEGSIFLSGGTTLKGFGKAAGIPAATFASGGSLNTARGYHGGAGTDHEALLAFGGNTGSATAITEQYNGSSWTEVSDLNTARANVTGFGSSTAAIAGNGSTPTKVETESWDGSSWTEIAETNFPRSDSTGAGTQTSGMIATGTPVPGNPSLQPGGTSTVTETWNGTSWTEVGDTNTKRLQAGMAGSGTTSASIIAAGEDGPGSRTVNAETWNGTSWTEVNNLSNQRGTLYNFMGNVSLANAAGGYSGTARLATNEHWNGTSWTEINDLSTARNAAYGAGAAADGAVFGGSTPSYTTATEEFVADNTLSTVTVS